jgi:hypothetical protein
MADFQQAAKADSKTGAGLEVLAGPAMQVAGATLDKRSN